MTTSLSSTPPLGDSLSLSSTPPNTQKKEEREKKEAASVESKKPEDLPPPTLTEINRICVIPGVGLFIGACFALTHLCWTIVRVAKVIFYQIKTFKYPSQGRSAAQLADLKALKDVKVLLKDNVKYLLIGILQLTWVGAVGLVIYEAEGGKL
jgi:hypothetical protein